MNIVLSKNSVSKVGALLLATWLLGVSACVRIYRDQPMLLVESPPALAVSPSATPRPPSTAMASATVPARVEAVVQAPGADYYLEPGLKNVEHFPAGQLPAGTHVIVEGRTADGTWLEVFYLGQAGLWMPASVLADYSAALESVPVSAEVFPTMDASHQARATKMAAELTLVAGGVAPGYAAETAQARQVAATTPPPPPFPAITATPPANCAPAANGQLECRTDKGVPFDWGGGELTFASPDQLRAVQAGYAQYLDLVMGQAGPPSQDFATLLRQFMVPAEARGYVSHDAPDHNVCTYGDITNHVEVLLDRSQYLRITPAGKLVWDKLDFGNSGGYLLSFDYTFTQRGHFSGSSTLYEIVDHVSGKVIRTVQYPRHYAFQANLVYAPADNGWRITFDDYCDELSWAGVW